MFAAVLVWIFNACEFTEKLAYVSIYCGCVWICFHIVPPRNVQPIHDGGDAFVRFRDCCGNNFCIILYMCLFLVAHSQKLTHLTWAVSKTEVREAMYYSSTYTIALVGWLQMLEWPVEIEHEDPGITFLELYISFCCATGSRVPFNTADKKLKVQTYQAFESDLLVKSMPYPLHQQLRVFEFSLAYIVKLFGDQAFPIGRKANVSSLIPIGFRTSRAGIRGRPKFPFRERIVSDLADFGFLNLAYKSIDGFSLPKLDPLIPTVLQDDDLVRNPHTSYTKFKRLLKRQWLFWESLRWLLFPWRNWTIWVEILTVSLLMASFASYGNDRFRHGYSTFSQSFWLGCGCVSRLSRGSVFWWDHQGGLTRDSRVRSSVQNPGYLLYISIILPI